MGKHPYQPFLGSRRTSAGSLCLGFLLLTASVPHVSAQAGKGALSDDPVAMRRAQLAEASEKIHQGDKLREAGDNEAARKQYAEAFEVLPDDALSARQLKLHSLSQYSETTLALAQQKMQSKQFSEAEALADDVLGVEPMNRDAAKLKAMLQNADPENPAFSAELLTDVDRVNGLLRNGYDLIELASYDAARESFNKVLLIDKYNTAARSGLEKVDRLAIDALRSSRDHMRSDMLRKVDEEWQVKVPDDLSSQFGSQDIGGGLEGGSVAILEKLKSIVFPRIEFLDLSLREVILFLGAKTKSMDNLEPDPELRGINFLLKGGDVDRTVTLSLSNIRLLDLIELIADQTGTSYSIEEYAVEFRSHSSDEVSLITRTFRVPPDFLKTAVVADTGANDDPFAEGSTGGGSELHTRMDVADFLRQNGVGFPDGASVFFNPSSSSLIARNTATNIGLIEEIVNRAASSVPRQVVVELKMIQTTMETLNELGMDTLVGGFNLGGSDRVFGAGGTVGNQFVGEQGLGSDFPLVFPGAGSQVAVPVGTNPLTAGLRSSNSLREQVTIDSLLEGASSGGSQKSPAVIGVSGVFTDPQFQTVLRALSQKKGVDLASSPSVVVRSGERASILLVREFIYPTEFDPPEIPQEFGGAAAGGGSFPVTPTTPTAFETRNVGTTFEVEPVISQDGTSVELNLAPAVVEFEGFVNYGSPITTVEGGETIVLTENRIPQPIFRVVQLSTTVSIWNNNTVVIGGLVSDEVSTINDKTPIFGDLPFLGSMFRSKVTDQRRRALIFFVTVKVVDPGGQPITGSTSLLSNAN
ncbi:MAG: type II and III secretion system protein [Verrucomicrobiae bacterium]|nr:type II and III secretion system protein [Verrucomicrobiae bacterium]